MTPITSLLRSCSFTRSTWYETNVHQITTKMKVQWIKERVFMRTKQHQKRESGSSIKRATDWKRFIKGNSWYWVLIFAIYLRVLLLWQKIEITIKCILTGRMQDILLLTILLFCSRNKKLLRISVWAEKCRINEQERGSVSGRTFLCHVTEFGICNNV